MPTRPRDPALIPPEQPRALLVRFDTHDLYERVIGFAVVVLLIVACLRILQPFLVAILWGITLAVATWPLFRHLRNALGDRPNTAAVIATLLLLLILVVPLVLLVSTLADGVAAITRRFGDLTTNGVPPPPGWLGRVPLIGTTLVAQWQAAQADLVGWLEWVRPYIADAGAWLLARGAALGFAVIELLLAVIVAGILYARGEQAAALLRRFVHRIGGEHRLELVALAGRTVRGVANGIVGTAIVQSLLAAAAFLLAGVPGTAILGLAVFMFSVLQLPTQIVTVPISIWVFYESGTLAGVLVLVWSLGVVGTIDNFLRPYLISQGTRLPLLLIFVGVIGGLLAFGFLGLFLGPVILATTWTLLTAWLDHSVAAGSQGDGGAANLDADRTGIG
jgi:predicted PurR-regulated permease PerM